MQPITLTKSRFKVALECPRKLAYVADASFANLKSEDEFLEALAEGGHQVGALAKLMHPGAVEINAPSVAEQVAQTYRLVQQQDCILFEPTFQHGNLVVRADVLVKAGNTVRLIEVKAKGFHPVEDSFWAARGGVKREWQPYLYDVAFQALVLERVHPQWTVTPHLMLLDTSAAASVDGVGAQFVVARSGKRVEVTVRPGFSLSALKQPLLRAYDVTKEVEHLRRTDVDSAAGAYGFEEFVDWLDSVTQAGQLLSAYPGGQCKRCEFDCAPGERTAQHRSGWAECMGLTFPQAAGLARSQTVFGLYNFPKVRDLLAKGHLPLSALPEYDIDLEVEPDKISRSQRHVLQMREAGANGQDIHLEMATLREALKGWRFPLHFIDFETARPALPFHRGRCPHDLLLFQFSHHVLEANGSLRHASQCLVSNPGVPPSIAVVRALKAALSGDHGTVVHWWDHEKTVLKGIREQIKAGDESDKTELVSFIDTLVDEPGRLADLGRLVSTTAFFPGTGGSSSIKKVLPVVLARSNALRQRYGTPVYGTPEMPSLNFAAPWAWLQEIEDKVRDPYELLDPMLSDPAVRLAVGQGEDDETGRQSFIANGGAAMVAYGMLQDPALPPSERLKLETQLKRYCELDTLAMVMVYQAIMDWLAGSAAP